MAICYSSNYCLYPLSLLEESMEYKYTQTFIGKIHAALVAPTIPLLIILYYLKYIKDKEPNLWGLIISFIGLGLFLKAKFSIIKNKKLISFGCDLMDQKNSLFYFVGWLLMIAGYFLSWS